MNSTADLGANLCCSEELVSAAAKQGSEFVVLPENFAYMSDQEQQKISIAEPFGNGKIQDFLSQQAKKHSIWLLGGTIPLQSDTTKKVSATSLLYDAQGQCAYRYDKIHLFDVLIDRGKSERYQESKTFHAGKDVVVATTPFARIGMSICYDLRFPELYRAMHKEQPEILAIPAAFTKITGEAHWSILLRSRAIENLCYVVASNQVGKHGGDRQTWGHSMIISPWGEILDCIEQGQGFAIADIDTPKQQTLRQNFPCLSHRILY
ncbi:FIG003879: Predicted amidohydrolase [uncultured Candidatus Thioglobus sp.]|nr:FIG003879: Predicted amidohydrolase [uncultured Candidatus Thioglobus sp.]